MPDAIASEMRSRRGWGMSVAVWALIALIAYALSPGPVMALWKDPPVLISAFYRPLETLYQSVPIIHDFYVWYFTLWGIK
jgi:hypothetical protein